MQRWSNTFLILKDDLKNGSVRIRNYQEFKEYWVYKGKKTGLIGLNGQEIESKDKTLYCVIIGLPSEMIVNDKEDRFVIQGVRFTNDIEGNDLEDYLKKTGRGVNG